MIALIRFFPPKVWLGIGVLALIAILYGAWSWEKARADRAVTEARQANIKADVLDGVATKTDQIRVETQEKEAQVDQIEGSDTRLPDNFGRDLQRVRDGKRNP